MLGEAALVASGLIAMNNALVDHAVDDRGGTVERRHGFGMFASLHGGRCLADGAAQLRGEAVITGTVHRRLAGSFFSRFRIRQSANSLKTEPRILPTMCVNVNCKFCAHGGRWSRNLSIISLFAMQLVRGLHNLSQRHRGCVLTVGNYDGVHLGHQHMIGVVRARAAELGAVSTVLAFEPSSKEFIDPAGAPPRLTRWREKYLALAAQGVDRLVTLRFDELMRAMTPQRFVDELMVAGLGVRHVVVGNDFRYGANACGTIDSLRHAGRAHGFGVEQIEPFVFDGVRVSSTVVRQRLGAGDFGGCDAVVGTALPYAGPGHSWQAAGPHVGVSHRKFATDAP